MLANISGENTSVAYVLGCFTQEENIVWIFDILVNTVLQVCSLYY